MNERIQKVNALLVSEIGRALGEQQVAGVLLTVTAVETTADLRQATVWISTLPDTDEAWSAAAGLGPVLQAQLAGRLTLRHTPRLQLQHDHGQSHAARIARLLEDG